MSTLVYRCRQIITDGELIGEFSVDRFVEKSVEGRGDGGYRGAPGQYPPGQGSRHCIRYCVCFPKISINLSLALRATYPSDAAPNAAESATAVTSSVMVAIIVFLYTVFLLMISDY
jgi:hypothetical protein